MERRMELKDAEFIGLMGQYYLNGQLGLQKDNQKGLELLQNAVELGSMDAYFNIGCEYYDGRNGVEVEKKKAKYYWEIAAIAGNVNARHNLGVSEFHACNWDRAIKHYIIAAGDGHNNSVKAIQELYKLGLATKDDYASALQNYQEYLDEIKSDQRDKAAAADDRYKYY